MDYKNGAVDQYQKLFAQLFARTKIGGYPERRKAGLILRAMPDACETPRAFLIWCEKHHM
jgi:hypothetical protein